MRHLLRPFFRRTLLLSVILAGGCSSFDREWKSAANAPNGSTDMSGRWHGAWVSQTDGHTGNLLCVITEPSENRYRAHFKATYWKFFVFEYVLNLDASPPANGSVPFAGKENLGWLAGGDYHYDGSANASYFQCRYSSKYDFGTFTIKRP